MAGEGMDLEYLRIRLSSITPASQGAIPKAKPSQTKSATKKTRYATRSQEIDSNRNLSFTPNESEPNLLDENNCTIINTENVNDDLRPYVRINILDMNLIGLIDTGASISCIAGSAAKLFLEKNISYRKLNEFVTTAGGTQYRVFGYLNVDIEFRSLIKNLRIYIIPDLKNELYLGIDFVRTFNILNLDTNIVDVREICHKEMENCHSLTPEMSKQLENVINLFPSFDREGLGRTLLLEHTIELEKGSKPVKQRYFSVSPAIEKLIHAEIDKMIEMGIIEVAPPNCPWSSPVTLVRKNEKVRLCLDSRRLNSVTVRDAYPQPKISNILSRLPKAEFITSLDLKHAFWQIGLATNSRDMTAFTVPNRPLYRFRVMPFGLTNAPQTMSRLMDIVIPPSLRHQVFIYLDDLLLVSQTFEDHLKLLADVAHHLRKAGLTLNIGKCKWCLKEVRYLGYIIGYGVVKTDPDKISAIKNLPPPKSVREVRKFLGLASWYRRFIENFSALTSPISDLTKKTKTFTWTDEADKAFTQLKTCLTTAPVLITPNFEKPFVIQCDASTLGIGGVLAQENEEGVERPIAFYSYKLNQSQRNYSITELECLAALKCIEKFREYVEGHTFKVVTDHASLQWLMRQTDLNGRLARWSLRLQGFKFSIVHRKGSLQTVPDALSRLSIEAISNVEIQPEIDLESTAFDSPEYPIKKFTAGEICDFLVTKVFSLFGVPEYVVTDNGTQFRSVQFRDLLSKYGIKQIFTAIYSPQSNSSERLNRSILAAIRSYLKQDQREWDVHLYNICIALRSLFHTSLGYSPYYVLFGYPMITHGSSYELLRKVGGLEEGENLNQADKLQLIRKNVKTNLEIAYNNYKKPYNLRARAVHYNEGDEVYRRNFVQSKKSDNFNSKLAPKWLRSIVKKRIGNSYYKVSDLKGNIIGTYHAKDLKPN
ncbi:uncharacterized protein LOC135950397 [Calliphora vicina]|uniref:uncharacterized protein LOC135950397 n=1 Tax=Calliphora vicina TaxID=7373 RepID=UPI00325AC095